MNIGHLVATLGVNTAGLVAAERSMRQFETRMQASVTRINASLRVTGAAMKKFGRGMTMYMTAPLALVGGAAFKMHMGFESSMSKIVGLVGVAQEQVNLWSKDILEMAPRLAKSPQELADALFFVTSAGLRGAEAMEVLEMSAKASAAGMGETKIVADLATSAMNAYGSAVLNAEQAMDIMVATVREGKAEAAELTASMGMVLPIASNMGVVFNEVGAAIAAMTRTGTSAATASMQLRQILASLLKPSQQSAELLKELGTTTEQVEAGFKAMGTSASYFRKVIREQGLLAALMEIKDLSAKFGEEAMSTVFPNIRALSGVLDILGENLEDNIALFGRMGITTDMLVKAFGAAADTTKHKFNVAMTSAKTALTILGKTVSKEVIPILKSITEKIQKLTEWFRNLDDSQRQTIVRITGLVAAIGPLSIALGWLIGNVLPGLIKVGYGAVKMFKVLTIAMMKNPFIALATVITIAITALVVYAKRTKEAADAQERLGKFGIEAAESTIRQRVELEQLFRVAQDENRELKKREEALKTLNSISPKYFGNLSTETINTENATEAKKKYIQELLREAKVKAAQETLIELEKQALKDIEQRQAMRLKGTEKLKFVLISAFLGAGKAAEYAGKQGVKNFEETKTGIENARIELQKFIDSLLIAGDPPGLEEDIISKIVPPKAIERMENVTKILKDFRIETEELNTGLVSMSEVLQRNVAFANELAESFYYISDLSRILNENLQAIAQQGLIAVGEGIVSMITGAEDMGSWLNKVGKMLGSFLQKMGVAIMAYGTAMEAFKEAFEEPVAAIAAGLALIIAGGLIKHWASKGPKEMGEGGIVTKPTLAIIGEKGTEAVIPLDKMNRQPIVVNLIGEWKMIGEDMHYIVKEQDRKHSNSF